MTRLTNGDILNAINGKTKVGATFDFSHAFGDFNLLPPHGVSDAVDMIIRYRSALRGPEVSGTVSGHTCIGYAAT